MKLTHVNKWETGAAFVVIGLGLLLIWKGSSYPMGVPSRMGPGFFPVWVGVLLSALGIALAIGAPRTTTPAPPFSLYPTGMILAAVVWFIWTAPNFGLIPATIGLVVLSSLADWPVRPWRVLALAIGIAVLGEVLFVRALNLPLASIRW